METLRETVAREAAKCEAVAYAWVAGELAFTLQTVVKIKRRLHKGDDGEWTYVSPQYAKASEWRAAEEAMGRVKKLHPEAAGTLVSYQFRPGGKFVEVFRRAGGS